MYKILISQFGQYKKAAILTPIFTGLEALMELLIPFITSKIIDEGIQAGNLDKVYFYGGIMLVMAFFSLVLGVLAGKNAAEASSGFACNLRAKMYENIQTFSFSNIDKFSTAGLVTRMTTDVTNVQNAVQMILRIASRAPLVLLLSMGMCFFINAELSVIFLIAMVILAAALYIIMSKTTVIFKQVFSRYDDLNAEVQENVTAIRVVKAFVREDHEVGKFKKAAQNLYDLSVKAESRLAFNNPVMMLVIYGCMIALSWFGAQHIVIGDLTTGELTSMFSYVMSMMMSLMMLSMVFVMITMASESSQRIVEVLTEESVLQNPDNAVSVVKDGSIDFENVSFKYSKNAERMALADINLHIRSGEIIGIIGGTGSSKSTLIQLIPRLYDVTQGVVRVGGVDVREYDLKVLRDQVAVVLQKNELFSGTIKENLRWGNEDATDAEMEEACKLAQADEFIRQFPHGYDTHIEQGGANVSGGQKQRLCIARALLKKPKILILDDSTSAVDTRTDTLIRQAFRRYIPETTKVIIAQRVASVQDADRIIVLDGGMINAVGTHQELLKTNTIYQEVYYSQNKAGDRDAQ